MFAIAWQVRITHLVATPRRSACGCNCMRLFERLAGWAWTNFPGPNFAEHPSHLHHPSCSPPLPSPVSFSADELEFISDYIDQCTPDVVLLDTPLNAQGLFWIDPDKDFPAHALIRRIPARKRRYSTFPATPRLNSRSSTAPNWPRISRRTDRPAQICRHPRRPGRLAAPQPTMGPPGQAPLPRRRQSYRANLSSGLDNLWLLLKTGNTKVEPSEWMVTNESPEGYALMHMSG